MKVLLDAIVDSSRLFVGVVVVRGIPYDACTLRFSEGTWICYPDPSQGAGSAARTRLLLSVVWE